MARRRIQLIQAEESVQEAWGIAEMASRATDRAEAFTFPDVFIHEVSRSYKSALAFKIRVDGALFVLIL